MLTADAESIYTNIKTKYALEIIFQYLRAFINEFTDYPYQTVAQGLRLIIENNVIQFGNTFWKQLENTAMGTPPAPLYATIFHAILENIFLDVFDLELILYYRFIDDIFGIWLQYVSIKHNSTRWAEFKTAINNPIYRLI